MRIIIFTIIFILFKGSLQSQSILPYERRSDWHLAGSKMNISKFKKVNIVADYGADNSGNFDNSDILQSIIDGSQDTLEIYFPPGEYLFNNTIMLRNNISITGKSPNATFLKFFLDNHENDLFKLSGSSSEQYVTVLDAFDKGSNKIRVSNPDHFEVGDHIEIEQENDPIIYTRVGWNQPWAQWLKGQIVKILEINENILILDRKLNIRFDNDFSIRAKKVDLKENVSLRLFSIERLDHNRGSNFDFYLCQNIEISCIYSKFATKNHVAISNSKDISIEGCFFDDAQFHCTGGAGYGVLCRAHTSEVKIENNIFRRLRHSMIVKEGANNNVYAYNYSFSPVNSLGSINDASGCSDTQWVGDFPDISVHGHYAYMNLFEHNMVAQIAVSDYWGPSGPGNTFFRNRVTGTQVNSFVRDKTKKQNFIGNIFNLPLIFEDEVTETKDISNYTSVDLKYSSTYQALPNSLYLDKQPNFVNINDEWPSIGPDVISNSISLPAYNRWNNHLAFDKLSCGCIPGLNSVFNTYDDLIIYYEYGNIYVESLKDFHYYMKLISIDGKVIFNSPNSIHINEPVNLRTELTPGIYIIKIYNKTINNTLKIIVH